MVHQIILKKEEKNIEKLFAYEDDDFYYGPMNATHLSV